MKKILFTLLSNLLIITSCNTNSLSNVNKEKLILSFSLDVQEASKDSNRQATEIDISDNKVTIIKRYGGRDPRKDASQTFKIKEESKQKIITFLKENKFTNNLKEHKEIKGIGISKRLFLQISKPFKSKISVEGMSNIWSGDEYVERTWGKEFVKSRTNIQNKVYFDKAWEFILLVEKLNK